MGRNTARPNQPYEVFADTVRERLAALDMTQGELANRIKVGRQYMTKVLGGKEFLSRERVIEVAGVLGLDPVDLAFKAGYLPEDISESLFGVNLNRLRSFVKAEDLRV